MRVPFIGGARLLRVVDLKLHMLVRWLRSGAVDHIPSTVFDAYPEAESVSTMAVRG